MHLPQALLPPQKALSWGAAGAAEGRERRSLSRRAGKLESVTFLNFPPLFLPFPPKKFLKISPSKRLFCGGIFCADMVYCIQKSFVFGENGCTPCTTAVPAEHVCPGCIGWRGQQNTTRPPKTEGTKKGAPHERTEQMRIPRTLRRIGRPAGTGCLRRTLHAARSTHERRRSQGAVSHQPLP